MFLNDHSWQYFCLFVYLICWIQVSYFCTYYPHLGTGRWVSVNMKAHYNLHVMHTYIHAHMHSCTHAFMHTCIHAHMHMCINANMLAYMHAFTSIHIYVHACICTYTHNHTVILGPVSLRIQMIFVTHKFPRNTIIFLYCTIQLPCFAQPSI